MKKNESLGITDYEPWYVKTLPEQDKLIEMININEFIKSVVESDLKYFNRKEFEFINYGSTQLVFVLTSNDNNRYTFLVTQPALDLGIGKQEYDNLLKLSKESSNVITLIAYYKSNNYHKELYITPYIYQSRCIGVNETEWGMWVPEPDYHFVEFNDKDKFVINSSMVAMLIKLYDQKEKVGITKCRLDGGDFMMKSGFEKDISYENILNSIILIAARELMPIDLDSYILLLKSELLGTNTTENIILGKRLRKNFTEEEINYGIKLGLELANDDKLPPKTHVKICIN